MQERSFPQRWSSQRILNRNFKIEGEKKIHVSDTYVCFQLKKKFTFFSFEYLIYRNNPENGESKKKRGKMDVIFRYYHISWYLCMEFSKNKEKNLQKKANIAGALYGISAQSVWGQGS